MNHIPGTAPKRFWTSKWVTESISSVPPVIVMGISAYRFNLDSTSKDLAIYALLAAVWLVLASSWKVFSTFTQEKNERAGKDHRDLRAAMYVLHAAVSEICKIDPGTSHQKLRATFHRVVPPLDQQEKLEQIVDYVGGDANGEGRTFSIRAGVTGKAARDGSPYHYHRFAGSEQDCRKELKESWGYTDKDLKTLSLDRMSAFAIPVFGTSSKKTIGIIYFDSTEKSLFREKKRIAAIVGVCGGLSQYITERYAT